ncbi:lipopolysaccharide-induced tumor necrosis factor-alpha factor homolog [Lingula anatina]|uniref:Lipopolysaccharide-induced tumor necrosis factor-alpha factor homolog n=1 Tax=Lingula anatina TaxID=7574 RepID=A0A1S3J864_LINAN|nr:lipopolysaccharide-induced tumor necrosis factor-alpha factor homolog [Lingula anatina]|eukprot:XP_013406585.1 lipopolysaccharide-induced tumor necrosis factor-alpha factor homolog [Lingula anatina]
MSHSVDIFTVLDPPSSNNDRNAAAVPPISTWVPPPPPPKSSDKEDIFVVQGYTHPTQAPYSQGGPRVHYNHQSTTVVVTSQPSPMDHYFTEDSVEATCPKCKQVIMTRLYHQTGTCTYLSCIVLCVIGFPCACCAIPFFWDRMKDVVHSCPKCRTVIGIHNRI